LKRDEVEADHAACEMDLADAVRENFFLVCHYCFSCDFFGKLRLKRTPPQREADFCR
jgi:hypothetical protein